MLRRVRGVERRRVVGGEHHGLSLADLELPIDHFAAVADVRCKRPEAALGYHRPVLGPYFPTEFYVHRLCVQPILLLHAVHPGPVVFVHDLALGEENS